MTSSHADVRDDVYHRHHRAASGRLQRRAKRGLWLVFNLTLLVVACACYGAAIHDYNVGETWSRQSSLNSAAKARTAYGHTMFFSLVGVLPLALGVRGEVKRKIDLEKRAQAKRNRAAQKKLSATPPS